MLDLCFCYPVRLCMKRDGRSMRFGKKIEGWRDEKGRGSSGRWTCPGAATIVACQGGDAVAGECPKCGESLFDLTLREDRTVRCPKCGESVGENVVATLWSPTIADPNRPDITLKPAIAPEPGRGDDAPGKTSTISSRLNLHAQSVADPGTKTEPPPHYELLQQLGEGGMGVVYQARQTSADRTIALKLIKRKYQQDRRHRSGFLSEAVATANLDHPNIVPVYDVGSKDDGTVFYAMKEVRGTEWKSVIKERSEAENLEILMRVADAVAFAHSKGVIHRDLKPENVMLGDFGEVLVMDWGLAAAVTDEGKADRLAADHAMGGTPSYMAPEMALGDTARIGTASDVYLLGATLFEILAGRRPHSAKDVMACLVAASRNEIVETDAAGELMDIAMKAMATEPGSRYPDVKAFQAAVKECQGHQESLRIGALAQDQLARAQDSGSYDDYGQAVFGFREALKLWTGNESAADHLSKALRGYAGCALSRGDLDLAISLLDANDPSHSSILLKAEAEKRARLVKTRWIRGLAYAFVALVIAGLITSVFVSIAFNKQKRRAIKGRELAEMRQGMAEMAQVQARQREEAAYENVLAVLKDTLGEEHAQTKAAARDLANARKRREAEDGRQTTDDGRRMTGGG